MPRLIEAKSGQWYVYFQVRDPLTDKMKPFKVYRGFKSCGSVEEMRKHGRALTQEIREKLQRGWTPWDKEDVIYNDSLAYEHVVQRFNTMRRNAKTHNYFLSSYIDLVGASLRPNTVKTYKSKLRIYCRWLEDEGMDGYDVSAVDAKVVKRFIDFLASGRELDRPTVEKYVQILRAFYDHLIGLGSIRENPVQGIRLPPKRKDMAARPIGNADMQELLRVIERDDPQLYLACLFIYYLSLRPQQELRLLKIKDVDLYNYTVTIVDGHAKVKRRTVNMPVPLREVCADYMLSRYNRDFYVFGRLGVPGSEPTGKNTLRNRFNRFRDALGMPDTYKFYSLKHTGGGNLLNAGATIEEIRDHMGHKSIETTSKYLRRHFGARSRRIIHHFPPPYVP